MDFEDERYSVNDIPSKSSSASLLSKDKVHVSIRGRMAGGRVRKRSEQNNISDDASIGSSPAPAMVVRGAGASAWAVQDAGTVQMLNDECSYLCSALLSARSAPQALGTALELAQLLSSKKSRSVLWQNCINNDPSEKIIAAVATPTQAGTTDSLTRTAPQKPASKSVLDSILDVIAAVGKQGTSSPSSNSRRLFSDNSGQTSASSEASGTVAGSPSRSARTKSARRKLKQQQQQLMPQDALSTPGIMSGWWSQMESMPELLQTLAIIVYFVSVDCTLSKDYSVAAMGAAPKPTTARSVRMGILQHGKALKGIVQLCLKEKTGTIETERKEHKRIPSTVSSLVRAPPRGREAREGSSFSSKTARSDHNASPQVMGPKVRRKRRTTLNQKTALVASSPAEDSLSSLSFPGETTTNGTVSDITPKASGSGDPTKAGRLKRRRKRLLHFDSALQERKLPGLPEESNFLDDLDWPGDSRVVPVPSKKLRTNEKGDSALSFESEPSTSRTNKSSIFTEPVSAARKNAIGLPQSPDDKSVASAASKESTNTLLTARETQKLQQLRSKVHFTSSAGTPSSFDHNGDCGNDCTNGSDPWASLLCLESLNRIITGKEGEESSCIAEEPNERETTVEDEESNPLLQTNRLLGDSGIIPLLSKCLSQEIKDSPIFSGVGVCLTCGQCWAERISILGSLIDGACLFNKANRRSFAEHHDPFSFENDLIHNKNGQGLIFHILEFLKFVTPTELSKLNGSGDGAISIDVGLISGVRLLALRTLTSLTHDNELAAQQMIVCHKVVFRHDGFSCDKDDYRSADTHTMRGIEILAELVFELESSSLTQELKLDQAHSNRNMNGEEESHLFDSTIFCLNTLANIIEAADVRRYLAQITVPTKTWKDELWIQWLCKWLVHQTKNFRDAILSIGKKDAGSQESERELEKHEEDKLVAAGNACVLLACLMKDPEEVSEEPESSHAIRKMILDQMPLDKQRKSTGVTMIINTLKAFCNYYHFSLGELSMAIVGPVKKLIDTLEEIRN